jgi:hypothetical protein
MVKRIAVGAGLAGAATLYLWSAAVRAAPEIRRRKAASRLARDEAARRDAG